MYTWTYEVHFPTHANDGNVNELHPGDWRTWNTGVKRHSSPLPICNVDLKCWQQIKIVSNKENGQEMKWLWFGLRNAMAVMFIFIVCFSGTRLTNWNNISKAWLSGHVANVLAGHALFIWIMDNVNDPRYYI